MARLNQAEARERARAAKRRLDADRHARDKQIEEAATAFYAGRSLIDEGVEAVEAAVMTLVDDLSEPTANVAVLLDINEAEVRRIRRQAKVRQGPDEDGHARPIGDVHVEARDGEL